MVKQNKRPKPTAAGAAKILKSKKGATGPGNKPVRGPSGNEKDSTYLAIKNFGIASGKKPADRLKADEKLKGAKHRGTKR